MSRTIKVVVEHHPDGYAAYPLGLKGVVVGQARPTRTRCGMSNRLSGSTWRLLEQTFLIQTRNPLFSKPSWRRLRSSWKDLFPLRRSHYPYPGTNSSQGLP